MDITLYHSPGACSMATYISLCEANADFKVEIINLKNNEQSDPAFEALNPKKKVPYLVVDGRSLSENIAMQDWIGETFPESRLMPDNRWDRTRALSYMGWFGSGIHPNITRHFKPIKFCADESVHDDIKLKAKAMYMQQLRLIENELHGKTWFFDHFTVCDSYFFWIYTRAVAEGFDLTEFEYCTAHNDRMKERDSVKTTLAHTTS